MSFQSRRLRVSFAPEITDECHLTQCCAGTRACPIPSEGCQHTRGEGPDFCGLESCFHNTGCVGTEPVVVSADAVVRLGPSDLAALHPALRARAAFEEEGAG